MQLKTLFLAALICVAGPLGVSASAAQEKAYKTAGQALEKTSRPRGGTYVLKNVKTGKSLKYVRSGQQLFPSNKGSPLSFKRVDKYVAISPAQSNNKCGSAAWHFAGKGKASYNFAMALYACAVTKFKRAYEGPSVLSARDFDDEAFDELEKRNARDGPIRHAKQYWVMKPGTTSHSFSFIALDHLYDMPTRALDSCTRKAEWNGSRYTCLNVYKRGNKAQEWRLYRSGKLVKREEFEAEMDELERRSNYGRWD